MSLLDRAPFARPVPSLALLVAVTMTGTVALHVFVPALPAAARDLGASPAAAGLTVTLFLVGLACGQLLYGPLSDRFGRRPILLGSLAVYLAGLLLAAPATTIEGLIGARVLQSLGACGALVLGRAMVRDVSTPADAARKLAVLMMCLTLTPALAPGLGGLIEAFLGWRAIFLVIAAAVGTLLLVSALVLPETNTRRVVLPGLGPILAGYGRLLRSAKFRRLLVAGSCGGTSLYAFLAVAPFLYVNVLRRSPGEVGLHCVVVSFGMVVGAAGARAVAGRAALIRTAQVGNLLCAASALALLLVSGFGFLSLAALTGTMVVYAVGIGIAGPNVVAAAMNVEPGAAGSASGLYGFSQMAAGALFSLAVGLFHDGGAIPLAATLLAASLVAAAALRRA